MEGRGKGTKVIVSGCVRRETLRCVMIVRVINLTSCWLSACQHATLSPHVHSGSFVVAGWFVVR
jgi:hypothetical protein